MADELAHTDWNKSETAAVLGIKRSTLDRKIQRYASKRFLTPLFSPELFFRFFKHVLGCRHLLSDDPNAITIQTYCAIIACMLLSLYTGRKPTLRTHEMICYYLMGWATEQELLHHLEKLKMQAG